MIKRAHLRQFLAVVDLGNFTRAAELVGISQPSLSAGIAELERLTGSRLFVRERRRIRLTDAGNRLLAHARAIEREFRLAETDVAAARPARAALRLGVLPSIATATLSALMAGYRGERELVLVEGPDAQLRRRLADGQVDAALTLLRGDEGAALLDEDYCMMLATDHPLAGRTELAVGDAAGETMIARRSCEILAPTSRFFTGHGVRPGFVLRSANDDRCMELVRIGAGVTTAPRSLARAGVNAVPLIGYDFRRRIGLVWGQGAPDDPALIAASAAAFSAG